MVQTIGRNINRNSTATVSSAITTNTSTSIKVADANENRTFLSITNSDNVLGIFIKLQAASADNDVKGIFLPGKSTWTMTPDNVYTGEVSAIADLADTAVFTTEY